MTLAPRDIDRFPGLPGVYMLKDAGGETLYIGKANSLRTRVRSHLRADRFQSLRARELARRTAAVETIVVGSGAEALILEANLIKEYRPRFNIQLRDDKSYPHIKVTVAEPFPRVFVTRRLRQDGSRYFGPYTSVGLMRRSLEVVKRLYTVRSCRYRLPREAPARPCLDHHIGRCQAPCVGLQSRRAYREMIDEILRVLGGETEAVRRRVEARMRAAAGALDFEGAAKHRTVLQGLDALSRHQRAYRLGGGDKDVIGLARDGELGTAVLLRIRGGLLLGRETRRLSGLSDEEDGALLGAVASRFYLGSCGRRLRFPTSCWWTAARASCPPRGARSGPPGCARRRWRRWPNGTSACSFPEGPNPCAWGAPTARSTSCSACATRPIVSRYPTTARSGGNERSRASSSAFPGSATNGGRRCWRASGRCAACVRRARPRSPACPASATC